MRTTAVTLDELKDWPPLVSVTDAGRALGIGISTSYNLIRTGSFPVPVVKVGDRNKVRTVDLVRFLGEPAGAAA